MGQGNKDMEERIIFTHFQTKTLMLWTWEIGGSDGGDVEERDFQGCRSGQGGAAGACLHSLREPDKHRVSVQVDSREERKAGLM